jgi:hypothetical protein
MFESTALVAFFFLSSGSAPQPAADSPRTVTCVFRNPGYSGQCIQNQEIAAGSTAQQTCETILSCLNNVHCTQTYCQATTVRGGWTLESATAGK